MMAKSAFREALEAAVAQRHSAVHPFSEAWVAGRLDKRLLGEWTKQHYHYVSHFSEWLATIYGQCPQQEVRDFLLKNIAEEEGLAGQGGHAAVRHTELLLDFAEACGKSRRDIVEAQTNGELLPETLGLQSWCAVQARKPFAEALAGLVVGLESQVPRIYRRTTPPLVERYGFSEQQITFFRLHIGADEEHGERGFAMVDNYAATAEQQQRCLRIVKEATLMRRLYLDGLYNKYLAPPSGRMAAE
jgi:pyrroloquinoline-quinone synthase